MIATDEPQRQHLPRFGLVVCAATGIAHNIFFAKLVVVELEKGCISIHQGDILVAVAIIVQNHKSPAVALVVYTGDSGNILELFSLQVEKKVISFIAT